MMDVRAVVENHFPMSAVRECGDNAYTVFIMIPSGPIAALYVKLGDGLECDESLLLSSLRESMRARAQEAAV